MWDDPEAGVALGIFCVPGLTLHLNKSRVEQRRHQPENAELMVESVPEEEGSCERWYTRRPPWVLNT